MSRLFSGVRSSCDMFARKSLLYLLVRASSPALSSSEALARAISRFLISSSLAFSSASSLLRAASSAFDRWSSRSSSSVRMLAPIMLSTTPMDWVSWSRKVRWMGLKDWKLASSMTALRSPSKTTGNTPMLRGGACPRPELTSMYPWGTSLTRMLLRSSAHWPTSPSPSLKRFDTFLRRWYA